MRRDWSGTHVEDLNSRNGIKVNKKKVKKKTLKDRDELEVGGTRLLYIDPTEVREAPVVLPDESSGENTIAPAPDEEPAPPPGQKTKITEDEPPKQEAKPEEPPPPDPASQSQPGEENPELGPGDSLGGESGAELSQEYEKPPLIDFSNKQTLILLAVAGVVGIAAIIFLVLVLAGA